VSRLVSQFIPGGEDAVAMPATVLAMQLLRYFHAANARGETNMCHPHNLVVAGNWQGHDVGNWRQFQQALMEAWAYLVAQGLVAPVPEQGEFHFITRRGMDLAKQTEPLQRLANEARIGGSLHASIAGKVR
jgi:putative intracellular protease/amidase